MKILKIALVVWIIFMIAYNEGYKKTSDKDYILPNPEIEVKKTSLPDSIRFLKKRTKEYHEPEVTVNPN